MSTSIALLCEGVSDPPTVRTLADRVIVAGVDWIDADEIDTHRHYRGFRPTDPYLTWFDIDNLADQYRVKSRGHFDGFPLHGDGHNTRKALILLTLHAPAEIPVEAIIIFRDGDREYDDRKEAITKVRDATTLPIPVVVGVANRMSECWIINGFDPTDAEQHRFEIECDRVKFDPRLRAQDLADRNDSDDRSPKRVLRSLSDGDRDRERACLWDTPLEWLRTRGEETGLKDFISELETRLLVAFR
jgi:hypothetical protein